MNKEKEVLLLEHYNSYKGRAVKNTVICIGIFLLFVGLSSIFKKSLSYVWLFPLLIPLADWISVAVIKTRIQRQWYNEASAQEFIDYATGQKKLGLFLNFIIYLFSAGFASTLIGHFNYHSFTVVFLGVVLMFSSILLIFIKTIIKKQW